MSSATPPAKKRSALFRATSFVKGSPPSKSPTKSRSSSVERNEVNEASGGGRTAPNTQGAVALTDLGFHVTSAPTLSKANTPEKQAIEAMSQDVAPNDSATADEVKRTLQRVREGKTKSPEGSDASSVYALSEGTAPAVDGTQAASPAFIPSSTPPRMRLPHCSGPSSTPVLPQMIPRLPRCPRCFMRPRAMRNSQRRVPHRPWERPVEAQAL